MRFQHEMRCAREFVVSVVSLRHHIVVSIGQISHNLTNRHHRLKEETKSFPKLSWIENWTIIKEVTGFQRLAIFRLLLATEMM